MISLWLDIGCVIGLVISVTGSLICFIIVLTKLFKEKGAVHGILGIIVSLYTFIWGWVESKRLRITKIMCFWTLFLVSSNLAVLGMIVIPKFAGRQQAIETAAKTEISGFGIALDAYEVDTGSYPQGNAGLNALVQQPSNAQNWKGPYLSKGTIPLDPWGNAYIYNYPGKNNPKGFDLSSVGPDGRAGGDDDITNWDDKR